MHKCIKPVLIILTAILILRGCKDPWDEHLKMNEGIADKNLIEMLRNDPDISSFTTCLVDAGWEEELASSKSYTIWAPDNDAMDQVDPAILADTSSLAMFVNNHICFTVYSYYSEIQSQTVKTFNGKNLLVDNMNGKVGEAFLVEPYDRVATNGILHVIDRALTPKPNLWDILDSTGLAPRHVTYLKSLSGMVFDPSIATMTGIDPVTGRPVYDTLSGMKWSNTLVNEVRDLLNEDTLSTLILLEDAVFEQEYSKYRNYFVLPDSVESDDLTRWIISRDLVFTGYMEQVDMPDTLVSVFGIKIPFDQGAIQQTCEASNGIIYVMSSCDTRIQDKIHPIIVEGEDTLKHVFTSVSGQTGFTREVELASGGYDFILLNHGANPGYLRYHMGYFVKGYYDFYWVAVKDPMVTSRLVGLEPVLQQSLEFVRIIGQSGHEIIWSNPLPISELITVVDSTYETAQEVYVGQRYFTHYQDVWLQVTSGGRNTRICLDYLKAVPVLE